jgi:hypothetical protein
MALCASNPSITLRTSRPSVGTNVSTSPNHFSKLPSASFRGAITSHSLVIMSPPDLSMSAAIVRTMHTNTLHAHVPATAPSKAICLDKNEARRKQQFVDVRYLGRENWQVPEKSVSNNRVPANAIHRPKERNLEQSTYVYAFGLLIRCMMCCVMDGKDGSFMKCHKDEEADVPRKVNGDIEDDYRLLWFHYPCMYSKGLVSTVQMCMRFLHFVKASTPEVRACSRPSLRELFNLIHANLGKLDAMYGNFFEAAQGQANHPLRVLFPSKMPASRWVLHSNR